MNNTFQDDEKLYRAVDKKFYDSDGNISLAAFQHKIGLSVNRGDYRDDQTVLGTMRGKFRGRLVSVLVGNCRHVDAEVEYLPTKKNDYHSEIHGGIGNEEKIILSDAQSDFLVNAAVEVGPL